MEVLAYINDNNSIKNYKVTFSIELFDSIQKRVDELYGKGELKEAVTDDINKCVEKEYGKKLDIANKTFICTAIKNDKKNMIYKYKYYYYNQSNLSLLCDYIKNSVSDSIEFSKWLGELFSWDSSNKKEHKLVNELRNTFVINKIDTNNSIISDISIEERKSALVKIKELLVKGKEEKKDLMISKQFSDDLEKVIDRKIKEDNLDYINQEELKNELKKKMVMIIPKKENIF